jgi:hypothetical protein
MMAAVVEDPAAAKKKMCRDGEMKYPYLHI